MREKVAGTASPSSFDCGDVLTTRRSSLLYWPVGVGFGSIGAVLLFVFFAGVIGLLRKGKGPSNDEVIAGLLLSFFGLSMSAAGWAGIRQARTRWRFHERALVVSRGRRDVMKMEYGSIERMRCSTMRHRSHGIYIGTSLNMKLKSDDGRRIHFSGYHKEQPEGFVGALLGTRFKGNDELDIIRLIIADHIGVRWASLLEQGQSVTWCGGHVLTPNGLCPGRGRYKGRVIPYEHIARIQFDEHIALLRHSAGDAPITTIASSRTNFWPGYVVLEQLQASSVARQSAPESRGALSRDAMPTPSA